MKNEGRADAGKPEWFGMMTCIRTCGLCWPSFMMTRFWLGVAGNQTACAGKILRELALPVDMVATSDDWGVSKPDPGFFHRLVEEAPCATGEIGYVGDRLDNDIQPASQCDSWM